MFYRDTHTKTFDKENRDCCCCDVVILKELHGIQEYEKATYQPIRYEYLSENGKMIQKVSV